MTGHNGIHRAVIYARYSSDLQSEASIEDQIRLCQERAEKDGHVIIENYADFALSGGSMQNRPGIQALMSDAKTGKFDLVIAEALDRLSRDQEDIAAIYKRLAHAEVGIVTLAEGEVTELHVGLKGTMNALFLKGPRRQDKARSAGPGRGRQDPWRQFLWLQNRETNHRRRDPGDRGARNRPGPSRYRDPHSQ